jgi:glutamine---fructose-6-phosphate transaminase (isomerizing)
MTHLLRDILRQPKELQRSIEFLLRSGAGALEDAKNAILGARHVFLTGIGSSWHAALTAGPLFYAAGRPVYMLDAAELLEFAAIPQESTVIVISRSGRSIEIVNLLAKVRGRGVTVIGITNSPDGALAREAQISIVVPIELDYAISVITYSTLALAAGILASAVAGSSTRVSQSHCYGCSKQLNRRLLTGRPRLKTLPGCLRGPFITSWPAVPVWEVARRRGSFGKKE